MLGICLGILFLIVVANGEPKGCESDPRDAIIYANQLARAVKHFMKNCVGFMDCFKGKPSINLLIEFFTSACNATLECAKKLGTEDVRKIIACSRPIIYSTNKATGAFTEEQMVCVDRAIDCALEAVPDVAVAKLLISYFRRMLG